MRERTSRTHRKLDQGIVRLTERDLWILEALGRMKFLATTQIARLAFGQSRPAANKRLRQLLNSGVVRAWVRDLAQDNIYSLSDIGARVLGPPPHKTPWPAPRGLDRELDHLLFINEIRIAFILGLIHIGAELGWWRSDWELRAHAREPVIPDALFRIGSTGAQSYALEVDNNTRSPRALLAKILRYRALGERGCYGVRDFTTLIVGADEPYLERCRRAVATTQITFPCWFTSRAKIQAEGILAPVWISLNGEVSATLPGLRSPPYGKEGGGQLNPEHHTF